MRIRTLVIAIAGAVAFGSWAAVASASGPVTPNPIYACVHNGNNYFVYEATPGTCGNGDTEITWAEPQWVTNTQNEVSSSDPSNPSFVEAQLTCPAGSLVTSAYLNVQPANSAYNGYQVNYGNEVLGSVTEYFGTNEGSETLGFTNLVQDNFGNTAGGIAYTATFGALCTPVSNPSGTPNATDPKGPFPPIGN